MFRLMILCSGTRPCEQLRAPTVTLTKSLWAAQECNCVCSSEGIYKPTSSKRVITGSRSPHLSASLHDMSALAAQKELLAVLKNGPLIKMTLGPFWTRPGSASGH